MSKLIIPGIYGLVSAILGISAIQHWYWWPGAIFAFVIGVVVDDWTEIE